MKIKDAELLGGLLLVMGVGLIVGSQITMDEVRKTVLGVYALSEQETQSLNEQFKKQIRELREKNLIDFTDKKDYPQKLKQLLKDGNHDESKYSTIKKAMDAVAREKGEMSAESIKNTTKKDSKNNTFNIKSKNITEHQSKLAKKKAELEAKKQQIESEVAIHNLIVKSDVYDIMKAQNYYTLDMIRETVSAVGAPVAPKEKYEAMAGMMTAKNLRDGDTMPQGVSNALYYAGMVRLFVLPFVPMIKEFFSDSKKEKEESEELLDESAVEELTESTEEEPKDTPKKEDDSIE